MTPALRATDVIAGTWVYGEGDTYTRVQIPEFLASQIVGWLKDEGLLAEHPADRR